MPADSYPSVWDMATGKETSKLEGHEGYVMSVAITRRGGGCNDLTGGPGGTPIAVAALTISPAGQGCAPVADGGSDDLPGVPRGAPVVVAALTT
jgi:hypothetical protein